MRHALLASLIVPLSSLVLAVGPVAADDEVELKRIHSAITEAIAEPIGGLGGAKIELANPVSAVWRDGRVIVSIKGAKLLTPVDAQIGIGDVEIAVVPKGDGLYDFDVMMPKSFPVIGDSPADKGTITLSNYKLKGTWSREVESIVNLDAMLDDLVITNEPTKPSEQFRVSIDDAVANSNYTKGGDGLWSGTVNGKVGAVSVMAPEGEGDLHLGGMEASAVTQGSDWTALAKAMNRMEEVMKPGAPPMTDALRQELAALFGGINWGDNEGTFSVKGIAFTQGGHKLFSLDDTTWKFLFKAAQEAGTLGLRLSFDGIKIEEQFLPPNLTPTKGALDITLEKFPVRQFFASMFMQATESGAYAPAIEPPPAPPPAESVPPSPETVEPSAGNPAAPREPTQVAEADTAPSASEMIGADANASEPSPPSDAPPAEPPPMASEPPMMGPFRADDPFLQKIFEMASVFVLNEFSVGAASAGISADGRLMVDPEAEAMGTGKLQAKLRGIDAVLEFVNQMASGGDEDMKGLGAFLIFLKGLGRAENVGGETVYVYDIDVPKQGAPTVNGTSLDNMDFD